MNEKSMLYHLRLSRVLLITAVVLAGGLILAGCGSPGPADEAAVEPEMPAEEAVPETRRQTATAIAPPPVAVMATATEQAPTDTPIAPPPVTPERGEPPPTHTPIAPPPVTATEPPPTNTPIAPSPVEATQVAPPSPPEMPILPTLLPTLEVTDCSVQTSGALVDYWEARYLGCPTGEAEAMWIAEEEFEGGRMIWRGDNGRIYALYNSGLWEVNNDYWTEGDPLYSCGVEQSPPTPLRGFGRVWCTYPEVQSGLGNATSVEVGANGVLQFFERGLMIQAPYGVYTLYEAGYWR